MTCLDPKTVEKLEGKIEEAIAEIIVKMGVRKLPLLSSRHTMHLMAKAAVAVYEAAMETYDRGGLSEKRAGTNRLCPRATPGTIRSQDEGTKRAMFTTPFMPLHGPCENSDRTNNLPRSTAMWRSLP